jgi:phosphoglycerate kinase
MSERRLADADVRGKRVLVREDLNVPLDGGRITDDTRILAAAPTLRGLSDRGAKVIVLSHLGRPDGKVVEALSLAPVASRLGEILGMTVKLAPDCVGPSAEAAIDAMNDGDVLLLENVRFHQEEEANDPAFAKQLAALGDLYVNDAFGTAHRAHASTVGITAFLPSYMGPLLARELDVLDSMLSNPRGPFVAVLGGAKVADKIAVVQRLMDLCDQIVVGGGMANTLLAAEGIDVGKSLRDSDLGPAHSVLAKVKEGHVKAHLHLPTDAVVAKELKDGVDTRFVEVKQLEPDDMILDIGPTTAERYRGIILHAKTVLWNGPMGVFENDAFAAGTEAVGQAIVDSGAMSVVGGGDSAAAAHQLGFAAKMTHISTGGGATLEYIAGRELPGVAALRNAAAQ